MDAGKQKTYVASNNFYRTPITSQSPLIDPSKAFRAMNPASRSTRCAQRPTPTAKMRHSTDRSERSSRPRLRTTIPFTQPAVVA